MRPWVYVCVYIYTHIQSLLFLKLVVFICVQNCCLRFSWGDNKLLELLSEYVFNVVASVVEFLLAATYKRSRKKGGTPRQDAGPETAPPALLVTPRTWGTRVSDRESVATKRPPPPYQGPSVHVSRCLFVLFPLDGLARGSVVRVLG